MPTDRDTYGEIIDYHNIGFATLAGNWSTLLRQQAEATRPGEFIAFPSYEWHSLEYGDHNVYGMGEHLALRSLVREAGGLAIPHQYGIRPSMNRR